MKFIKSADLKPGMRLAKPIYNKHGVLLYDRNTKLTMPGINSIQNFGLIGIYTLEPAEPLPPLSREDLEFEQNQTIYMFKIREIFEAIRSRRKLETLPSLVSDIRAKYGSLDHRVNFNQNLRSSDDFIYKHAISTSLLTAMLSSRITMTDRNRDALVCASLLYDFGFHTVPASILEKGNDLEPGDRDIIQRYLEKGCQYLTPYQNDFDFFPQAMRLIQYYIFSQNPENTIASDPELNMLAAILRVADNFDRMTAMNLGHEPDSEIIAMKHLRDDPEHFAPDIVDTLAQCIHIVPTGASVDLSTGDKGIILVENPADHMHPVLLRLSDNQIYDLSDPNVASEIQIVDIMKTMDNRIQTDEDTLKQFVPDQRLKELAKRFRRK